MKNVFKMRAKIQWQKENNFLSVIPDQKVCKNDIRKEDEEKRAIVKNCVKLKYRQQRTNNKTSIIARTESA